MTALHPGVTREQCVAATGWPLRFTDVVTETAVPSDHELSTLRHLQAA
jgi:glutaconate CoA-transferase subunit B